MTAFDRAHLQVWVLFRPIAHTHAQSHESEDRLFWERNISQKREHDDNHRDLLLMFCNIFQLLGLFIAGSDRTKTHETFLARETNALSA